MYLIRGFCLKYDLRQNSNSNHYHKSKLMVAAYFCVSVMFFSWTCKPGAKNSGELHEVWKDGDEIYVKVDPLNICKLLCVSHLAFQLNPFSSW